MADETFQILASLDKKISEWRSYIDFQGTVLWDSEPYASESEARTIGNKYLNDKIFELLNRYQIPLPWYKSIENLNPEEWTLRVGDWDNQIIHGITGVHGARTVKAKGYVWIIWNEFMPFDPDALYEMSIRVKHQTQGNLPDAQVLLCGWECYGADQKTIIGTDGSTDLLKSHFFVSDTTSAPLVYDGGDFVVKKGYVRGLDTAGTAGEFNNPDNPGVVHEDVRYFRPAFAVNSDGASLEVINGSDSKVDIDSISIVRVDDDDRLDGKQNISGWPVVLDVPGGTYDVSLSYDPVTRKTTLTPTGATADVFVRGQKFVVDGTLLSDAHPATTGGHFYYHDGTDFVWTTDPWQFDDAPTCFVYYSTTVGEGVGYFELHSSSRDPAEHRRFHEIDGTQVASGGEISDYVLDTATDAAVTFSVEPTTILDEDIEHALVELPDNGPYTVWWRTGAGGEWVWSTGNSLPFEYGTYPQYNDPSWGLTDIPNGEYANYYLMVVPALDTDQQYILIPGQQAYPTEDAAKEETLASLSLGTLPFQEIAPLYQLTFEAASGYGGTAKTALVNASRIIGSKAIVTQSAVQNHNALSSIQGGVSGEYYHLTMSEETNLTGGGDTTLHYHDTDRDRTTHTGSQSVSSLNDHTVENISDVTLTAIGSNEILKWTGSAWINNTLTEAGIAPTTHNHTAAQITSGTFDNGLIAESNVTQHEAALTITEGQISGLNHYDSADFGTDLAAADLDDIGDVTLTTIAPNELLKWSGSAWVNQTLEEAEIAPLNHTHTESEIDDLKDYVLESLADTKGDILVASGDNTFTILAAGTNDYVLTADSSTGTGLKWATGGTAVGVLNDLTDVVITGTPADNELLAFDSSSGDWINQTANEAGLATTTNLSDHESDTTSIHGIADTSALLTGITGENLSDLFDVNTGTPDPADVLTWDNGTSKWIASPAGTPGAHDLTGSSHTDSGLTTDDLLTATGASTFGWVTPTFIDSGDTAGGDLNGTYPNPSVDDGADATAIHDDTSGEIAAIAAKGTPTTADFLIIEDAAVTNTKKSTTIGDLPFSASGHTHTHNSTTSIQGGTTAQYYHLTSAQHVDLTDAGESALHYHDVDRDRGNHTGTQSVSTLTDYTLANLTDVTITGPASDDILQWSGAAWVDKSLNEAGIAAASHNHAASHITSGTFDNALIAESNVTQHEDALTILETQITADYVTYAAAGHSHAEEYDLADLGDVTITGPATNDVIQWGGSAWVDQSLSEAGISATGHTHTHNSTTSIQGGTAAEYYHLTSAQHTDLTNGGESTLHYHDTDRDRANHTGNQLHTTISDFDSGVQANTLNSLAVPTATVDFNQQFIDDVKDPTSDTHVGDRGYNDTRYVEVGEAPTAHTHAHNDTTSKQGGTAAQYYHLTSAQHGDLTDAGESALHYHDVDRARGNHTGTQALGTITGHDKTAHDALDIDADTLDNHDTSYFLDRGNHTSTQALGTITGHNKSAHDALGIDAETLDDHDSSYFATADHTHIINDLTDVVITGTPAENELLAYDSGSGDWINQTAGEAGLSVSGHTHAHNDTTSIQGGTTAQYYHLTSTQHTDLTDTGESALHYHDADRARADHTGTQNASTISGGTFDDGLIAESNVTQHEGAIDHDALTNFDGDKHIDWTVTGAEDVHVDRISETAVTQHEAALTIAESQITGLNYYDSSDFATDLGASDLGDVGDVTLTAIGDGELLRWNGGGWVNNTLAEADLASLDEVDAKQNARGFPVTLDVPGGTYEVSLDYDETTRKVTVTPTGASFDIYVKGDKITTTGAHVSAAHPATLGGHFYFHNGTDWEWNTSPWNFDEAPVCYVYWSTNLSDGVGYFELHTTSIDPAEHRRLHEVDGTQVASGGDITGYTLDTDSDAGVTFGVNSTTILDEDIERANAALPDDGPYTVWYRTGVGGEWVWSTGSSLPFEYGTYPQYNDTSWGLTDLAHTKFCNYYLMAVPAIDANQQYILIPGQVEYDSLDEAKDEDISQMSFGSLPFAEVAPLWKFTWEAKSSYGGTAKTQLRNTQRLVGSKAIVNQVGVVNHNALGGIQGGVAGEYFHLTATERAFALAAGTDVYTSDDTSGSNAAGTGNSGTSVTALGYTAAKNNTGNNVVAIGKGAAEGNTYANAIAIGNNADPIAANNMTIGSATEAINTWGPGHDTNTYLDWGTADTLKIHTNSAEQLTISSTTIDAKANILTNIANPTNASHVGDRLYNDGRYILDGQTAGGDLNGTYPNPSVDDGADSTAIHDNVSGEIVVVAEKTTMVANDEFLIEDSAASNAKKSAKASAIRIVHTQVTDFDTGVQTNTLNSLAVPTGTVDFNNQFIDDVKDPTADTHVGDRAYNDTRYINVGEAPTAHTHTHNSATSIQGGTAAEYYHLTSTQHTDLTDSGASTLHYHTADRARADHTGTQLHTTISDFDSGVQVNRLDQMAAPSATVSMNSQYLSNPKAPTLGTHVGDRDYNDDRYVEVGEAPTAHTHAHNDTTSIQGGTTAQYFHLTSVQHSDLTDAGNSTLHYHDADRVRGDHTGTQALSTITGHDKTAHDALGIDAETLDDHDTSYFLDRGNHTSTQLHTTISDFDSGVQANTLNSLAVPTGTVDFNQQFIDDVKDPTGANHVGDRAYNDARYVNVGEAPTAHNHDSVYVNITGDTMTGALLLDNDGDATTPDLAFAGDPNTGIYSSANDTMNFTVGGTEQLTVNSSDIAAGRVKIGSSSFGTYVNRAELVVESDHDNSISDDDFVNIDSRMVWDVQTAPSGSIEQKMGVASHLDIAATSTETLQDNIYLSHNYLWYDADIDSNSPIYGVYNRMYFSSTTSTNTVATLYADNTLIDLETASGVTITTAKGHQSHLRADGGTIGTMYNYHARVENAVTTVTNHYGLYIDPLLGGTLSYGIYQEGTSDLNYFGGSTQIAGALTVDTDPTTGDHVGNRDYNDIRYINVGEAPTAHTHAHNDTTSIQGGTTAQYYHLTSTQHTDLTDAGASALHYHTADRARADHTGTQLHTTISDFDTGVRTNRLDQMTAPAATVSMNSQYLSNPLDPTLGTHVGDRDYNDTRYINVGEAPTAHTHAHNDTTSLQGGTAAQYYHLTSAQHTDLTDGNETTLHHHDSAYVDIDGDTMTGFLKISDDTDASLVDGTGALQVGSDTAANIGFDTNQIQARSGSAGADLFINWEGGNLNLGHASFSIGIYAPMSFNSTTLSGVADPTAGTHVGDRDYNDTRYVNVGEAPTAHTHTHASTTGRTANDHHTEDHASRHRQDGADPLTDLYVSAATSGIAKAGYNNSGTNVVALGDYAGGGGNVGDRLTAVGSAAGDSLTTPGASNTMIGDHAGRYSTNLEQSTLIGRTAGYNVQLSALDAITSVGFQSGYASEARDVVYVGLNAGYDMVAAATGAVMLGQQAGQSMPTPGSHNVGVGYQTLYGAANHTQSTAIGSYAGYQADLTSSNNLTALGYEAGRASTGIQNTMIGFEAGEDSTGNNIIAIGPAAAKSSTYSTTIAIGKSAAPVASNTMTIGSATGAIYNWVPGHDTNSYLDWGTADTLKVYVGAVKQLQIESALVTVNNKLTVGFGAVGSPSIRFGDATTGFYRTGADKVAVSSAGVQQMRWETGGTVANNNLNMQGTFSLIGPKDPTAGTHVGDMDFNDARYINVGEAPTAHTHTHNSTTSIQGGTTAQYYHLTSTQHTDLTDGNDSTLHKHSFDRARANHTGTQAHTTILDFDAGVQTNRLDQMANPTAALDINAQNLDAVGNIDFGSSVGDKLNLYSNTFGMGIESSTLTYWSGGIHKWGVGGTSAATTTAQMTLSATQMNLQGNLLGGVGDPTDATYVGDRGYNDTRYLQVGGDTATGIVYFTNATDVNLADGTGTAQFGASGAVNIGIDGNEIQCRVGGAANTLYLQNHGGNVQLGYAIQAPAGSAASPNYAFTSDPGNGMYMSGTDNVLRFSTSGTEYMSLSSTSFTVASLQIRGVTGTASAPAFAVTGTDSGMYGDSTQLKFSVGGTEKMRLHDGVTEPIDIWSGGIDMNSNKLTDPLDPTAGTHVGDRDYNDNRYLVKIDQSDKAGNTAVSSTSYADSTIPTLTVSAATDDWLELNVSGHWNNEAIAGRLDGYIADGTDYMSGNGSGGTGHRSWAGGSSLYVPTGGSLWYKVVAANVVGGEVDVKIYIKASSASTKTLLGPVRATLINHGASG